MKVSNRDLQDLGRNLKVDEDKVQRIYLYDQKEHHQRLIEAWFDLEDRPTLEKLQEALPRRDSIRSNSSSIISPTPLVALQCTGKLRITCTATHLLNMTTILLLYYVYEQTLNHKLENLKDASLIYRQEQKKN